MEKTQHTPGPWLTKSAMSNFDKGKESIFVVNGKGDSVRIAETSKAFNGSITRANARLIAAAPELLVEVERAARLMEIYAHQFENDKLANQQMLEHAAYFRAAIAKATGASKTEQAAA